MIRNSIYVLLIVLIAASCSPAKQIARLERKGYIQYNSDTIYVSGESHDTTVYLQLPADTVENEVVIFVEEESPVMEPVEAETEHAYARAEVRDDKILLTLIQKAINQPHVIEDAIKQDTIKVVETVEVIKEKIPKSFYFYRSGFWILALLYVISVTIFVIVVTRKR